MLRFVFDQPGKQWRRREWLRLAAFGGLSGATANLGASPIENRPAGFGRAKSVIVVFASGGQSQLDMWDPKPNMPAHIRGAFSTISTATPGVAVCEHMPKIARVTDRCTIVRSMSHEDTDHGSAIYLTLTGRYHSRISSNPPVRPTDFPTIGAVLQKTRKTRRFVYDSVHVNGPVLVPTDLSPGQNSGFLAREHEPLVVGNVNRQQVAIPGLRPRAELPPVRLAARQQLKTSLDAYARQLDQHPLSQDMRMLYGKALDVLTSPRCRAAFDLSREPVSLRDRYGRHRSGQACLLARRLVEAGVPLITVFWNHSIRGQDKTPDITDQYGWDTHNDIFDALKVRLLPRFDESFSTLIEDLDTRGLLDDTLVICMGEFGRAPLVALERNFAGNSPGRKHWASAYSIVMAGAGVGRGAVVGKTDRSGGQPDSDRFGPWDVAATIYSALGMDPHQHFTDSLNRPFPLTTGRVMEAVYRS